MPKTAVNKNHFQSALENEIGLAGKFVIVQSIPVTHAVNQAPDG
jgi:hypothetical protein